MDNYAKHPSYRFVLKILAIFVLAAALFLAAYYGLPLILKLLTGRPFLFPSPSPKFSPSATVEKPVETPSPELSPSAMPSPKFSPSAMPSPELSPSPTAERPAETPRETPPKTGGLIKNFYSLVKSYDLTESRGDLTSFTEIFSSDAWKDDSRSAVYQNLMMTAISFPPKYGFREITPPADFSPSGAGNQSSCLAEKGECLSLKSGKVFLAKAGQEPSEIKLPFQVVALGRAGSFWLLGSRIEKDKKFATAVYLFDGEKYNQLAGEEFYNAYFPGEFISGGSDGDFLAGFQGLESKVLRLVKEKDGYSAWDVSFWFGPRLGKISGVEFIQTENGYVFFSESSPLFMVTSGWLAIDLTEQLGLDGFQKVVAAPAGKNKFLIAGYDGGFPQKFFEFENLGFDKSKPLSFYSSNLAVGLKGKKAVSAAILEYLGDKKGGDFRFYFSADAGQSWIEAKEGKTVYFTAASQSDFRWRVDFSAGGDDFSSPFLRYVRLSYGME